MTGSAEPLSLLERWQSAWPQALAVWSQFTRLSDPNLCQSSVTAAKEGLTSSFAMIRLSDQSVVVDLEGIERLKLEDCSRGSGPRNRPPCISSGQRQ